MSLLVLGSCYNEGAQSLGWPDRSSVLNAKVMML